MRRQVRGRTLGWAALLGAWTGVLSLASQLPVRVFTTRDGLPRNSVSCMLTGPGGMLWLCTSEGLVRFDGTHFRAFDSAQGLPSKRVIDFVPSRDGGYWVVTSRGPCHMSAKSMLGDACRLVEMVSPHAQFQTQSLVETAGGETFIATGSGIYKLSRDAHKFELALNWPDPSLEIATLGEGLHGDLLICTLRGMFAWRPGGEIRNLTAGNPSFLVRQTLRGPLGEIWLATGIGAYRLNADGNGVTRCGSDKPTNAMLRRGDGSIWGAGMGVWRLAENGVCIPQPTEVYTGEDGIPAFPIMQIAEDHQGNLWGTTEGNGIFRISNSRFHIYAAHEGLDVARIAAVFENQDGAICALTFANSYWLHVLEGKKFVDAPILWPPWFQHYGWGWNQFGLQAHDGEWWLPTGQGLFRFPRASISELAHTLPKNVYGADSAIHATDIFRVFEDSGGDIWVSWNAEHTPGFARWRRGENRFQVFGEADGYPNQVTTGFREARNGDIWIAATTGVARYRNGRIQFFRLGDSEEIGGLRDMMIDHAGRLWIASSRGGLFRCDNAGDETPSFQRYTVREGLSADSTRSLVEDLAGFIYVGCTRNVDRIDPAAPIESRRIRHITPAEGLPDSENSVAMRDRRGHLWFGTLHGLAEFDPSQTTSAPPADVYLTRVRVRGDEAALPWEGARQFTLDLPADRNQVEIEWVGVDLRSAESLRYQYRLGGVDDRWSDPADRLSINYATLPPGRHRFEVRAVNEFGEGATQPASMLLDVAAPYWRRWWFLLSAALGLSAIATAMYNYRVGHLLAFERLRTRIATDLHDDMGSNLTQISILSEVAARKEGGGSPALSDIAAIARQMVEEMNDIVWAVNPRHDRLEDLAYRMRRFAGDTLSGAGIELRFDAEGLPAGLSVPLEARRPLYLVFKEAVNNIARHSQAANVVVCVSVADGVLKLALEDDGRGFDPATVSRGEGLHSMAMRMKAVGGTADWKPTPGGGAGFVASLPLRQAGRFGAPQFLGKRRL